MKRNFFATFGAINLDASFFFLSLYFLNILYINEKVSLVRSALVIFFIFIHVRTEPKPLFN